MRVRISTHCYALGWVSGIGTVVVPGYAPN